MMGNSKRLGPKVRRLSEAFKRCQSGAVPLFLGAAIFGVVGFTGLGIDGANWYAQKRFSQNIADSAAVAATHAALNGVGNEAQTMEGYALAAAIQNGFVQGEGSQLVVSPIAAGGASGLVPRVEVTVVRDVPAYFAGILIDFKPQVSARAVGGILYSGKSCVVGLDPDDDNTVYLSGNNTTTIACGVASNSESDQSLVITGRAVLDTASAQAAGNIVVSGQGQLLADDELVTSNHPAAADPFEDHVFPDPPGACDIAGYYEVGPQDDVDLGPATPGGDFKFCGDVAVKGELDLVPGTYYIHESDLTVESGAVLTCSGCTGGAGVTLVLSGTAGENIGTINIKGQAEVDLRAPDSGPYAGLIVYQQPSNDQTGINAFEGGATMQLNGGIYIPAEEIRFAGGSDEAACTVIVGRKVTFTGGSESFVRTDAAVCAEIGLGGATASNQQRLVVLVQ